MAREIQFGPWPTGATLYAILKRASDGYIRDVVANAWDVPLTADWGDYDVALTEDSTTGHYQASAPSGVTLDGTVSVIVYERLGGSPATTDTYVGEGRALRVDVRSWLGSTAPANTGDAYARLGAPAGASVSADIAAVQQGVADTYQVATVDGVVLEADQSIVTIGAVQQAVNVGGMNADTITASALAADAVAEIAAGVAAPSASTIAAAVLAALIDGVALSTVLSRLNAMARGKVVKTGDAYAYKAEDGTTTLFTLTIAAGERTTA